MKSVVSSVKIITNSGAGFSVGSKRQGEKYLSALFLRPQRFPNVRRCLGNRSALFQNSCHISRQLRRLSETSDNRIARRRMDEVRCCSKSRDRLAAHGEGPPYRDVGPLLFVDLGYLQGHTRVISSTDGRVNSLTGSKGINFQKFKNGD